MYDFMFISNLVDAVDRLLRKEFIRIKIDGRLIELQRRLKLQAATQEHCYNSLQLLDAACNAYWELHVVDGSEEVALQLLQLRGFNLEVSRTILQWVKKQRPIQRKKRASSKRLTGSPKQEDRSCGG